MIAQRLILMRSAVLSLALALSGSAAIAQAFEPSVDRPGSDYRVYDLGGGAQACQRLCGSDLQCRAWTFVQAGVQGPSPRCYLKGSVPRPYANNCCISGVMTECCPQSMLVCPLGRHFC